MGAILADDILKCIFFNKNDRIETQISLKFVLRSPIDNKPVLVQLMAWRQTGTKPLPEPLLAQFSDVYHQVSNIRRTLVGSKIVDHSDVVGASSPVGAAPATSSFST